MKIIPFTMLQRVSAAAIWVMICFNFPKPSTCFSWVVSKSSLATSPAPRSNSRCATELHAISKRNIAIFDGSELASIDRFLQSSSSQKTEEKGTSNNFGFGRAGGTTKAGYMTLVTGTTEGEGSSRRIVGVQVEVEDEMGGEEDFVSLGGGIKVYRHASATIPKGISEDDALSTFAASIGVHCASPRVEAIGGLGGAGADFISGKVVVLGGSDYARFVADAMGTLGAQVYLVSTRGGFRPKSNQVKSMGPAVGDDGTGFAAAIGQFDSLVDTIGDETGGASVIDSFTGGVISELKKVHKCERYVSTMTKSQKLILDDGVLFGPGKAKSHEADVTSGNMNKLRRLSPPLGVGTLTLEKLLNEKVVFPSSGYNKKDNSFVRGWSLKDFWETTSWPRDADAGTNVRYGLPVNRDVVGEEDIYMLNDDEMEDDFAAIPKQKYTEEEEENEEEAEKKIQKQKQSNPYVLPIRGVKGLNEEIVSEKRDCVLFLSAPYCRLCKSINPQYTRMARLFQEDGDDEITFAKSDAVGKVGKGLTRALEVESVPTFVMFKDGKRYGCALSIPSLPSKKLNLAVEYLSKGKEWDSSVILADDEAD